MHTIIFKSKIFAFLFITAFIIGILNFAPRYAFASYHEETTIQKIQQKKTHTRILILLNNLHEGDQNQDVKALQDRLKLLGFFPKNVKSTGFFGPITKKAVMDFQKSKKIKQTGFVEILTRANLALTGFK